MTYYKSISLSNKVHKKHKPLHNQPIKMATNKTIQVYFITSKELHDHFFHVCQLLMAFYERQEVRAWCELPLFFLVQAHVPLHQAYSAELVHSHALLNHLLFLVNAFHNAKSTIMLNLVLDH